MKVGLFVSRFTNPGGPGALGRELAEVARVAERAGFDSFWLLDHFFQMEHAGPVDEPMLEAYTTLAYIAGVTTRMALGTLVTGVIYRPPALLVKTVTTLDVLSGGRAWLGIGAAWYEREALGLGLPFPPLAQRFEQLEETLQIARRMWSGTPTPFDGQHFHLAEPLNSPAPVSQPYPKLLIGGTGEKKTLRLVAQYADASNFGGETDLPTVRHKLAVLREHCDAVGRDYASIEKTVVRDVNAADSMAQVADACVALAEMGVSHVMLLPQNPYDLARIEALGRDVLPDVQRLNA